jgi:hypothetical protein
MATSKPKMVSAVFRDRFQSIEAYDWLKSRGYANTEISVLMSDATRAKYYNEDPKDASPIKVGSEAVEGMGVGGAIGTVVGASLAAFAAIGTSLVVPGLGLVVAGPIVAALTGAGAGAVTGGLIGGLVGLGIPESNAKAYEEALRDGGVVIGVVPRNNKDGNEVKKHFEANHGENVLFI